MVGEIARYKWCLCGNDSIKRSDVIVIGRRYCTALPKLVVAMENHLGKKLYIYKSVKPMRYILYGDK